jgi:hypothetical protein
VLGMTFPASPCVAGRGCRRKCFGATAFTCRTCCARSCGSTSTTSGQRRGNPSYGGVRSRSDLVLKQERIVIETKMTRKSLAQKELALQLIRGKEQYRGNPDCGTLVFFGYDPERRLSNSGAIEHDLSNAHGRPTAVVVISARGLWAIGRPDILTSLRHPERGRCDSPANCPRQEYRLLRAKLDGVYTREHSSLIH